MVQAPRRARQDSPSPSVSTPSGASAPRRSQASTSAIRSAQSGSPRSAAGPSANWRRPHIQGRCMSTTPIGDQTQLSSGPSRRRYLPSTTSCRHCTREKSIRQTSPACGGQLPRHHSRMSSQGQARVTDHPRSSSDGSFSVPSTWTPDPQPLDRVGQLASLRAVGIGQPQVPGRAQGVDLQFQVVRVVPVRVEEHLEVVVVEDHRVALRQRPPDVRLLQLRPDVQRVVVPQHLRPRPKRAASRRSRCPRSRPSRARGPTPARSGARRAGAAGGAKADVALGDGRGWGIRHHRLSRFRGRLGEKASVLR